MKRFEKFKLDGITFEYSEIDMDQINEVYTFGWKGIIEFRLKRNNVNSNYYLTCHKGYKIVYSEFITQYLVNEKVLELLNAYNSL